MSKKKPPLTIEQMHEQDRQNNARDTRADAFMYGPPKEILEQWDIQCPTFGELYEIIRNMLERMQ